MNIGWCPQEHGVQLHSYKLKNLLLVNVELVNKLVLKRRDNIVSARLGISSGIMQGTCT